MTYGISTVLYICVLVFLAGFIDAIAGGGGLISLPAYLSAGLPPHLALATNKFSSTAGTFTSFLRFRRNGKINGRAAAASALGALPGSYLGARLILVVDEIFLKYFLIILLPVIAIIILRTKSFGETDNSGRHSTAGLLFLSFVIGLVLGTYDGFFGPGTGTFMILAFSGITGFNLATASGNTKVDNLASNAGGLAAFIMAGRVVYAVGLPAALAGILGNWLGSGLAVKKGARIIRPFFIFIVVLLFAKILYDLLR